MLHTVNRSRLAPEGYVYNTYGHPKYVKHAVASVVSLRRYDTQRPVGLVCVQKHKSLLEEMGLAHIFDVIKVLKPERASIIGFKHNVQEYMLFEKNLFLDSDIIWCKNPDDLWISLKPFDFTTTGTQIADNFFGGPKNFGVVADIFLQRRQRTLDRFGLSYLSRVQTGLIYASNYNLTKKVCDLSAKMLDQKQKTHFRSRTMEHGRSEESCEWSMAMAMSKLEVPVYPWLQGKTSAQLDYVADYTEHDRDFEYVKCRYYSDRFVYNLRGIKNKWVRNFLTNFISMYPGKGDYMMVTPFCLHFGWYHQKKSLTAFAERTWNALKERKFKKFLEPVDRIEESVK